MGLSYLDGIILIKDWYNLQSFSKKSLFFFRKKIKYFFFSMRVWRRKEVEEECGGIVEDSKDYIIQLKNYRFTFTFKNL